MKEQEAEFERIANDARRLDLRAPNTGRIVAVNRHAGCCWPRCSEASTSGARIRRDPGDQPKPTASSPAMRCFFAGSGLPAAAAAPASVKLSTSCSDTAMRELTPRFCMVMP